MLYPSAEDARELADHLTDLTYLTELTALADEEVTALLEAHAAFLESRPSHRPLARRLKVYLAVYGWAPSRYRGDARLLAACADLACGLERLLGAEGLFGGDNLVSPPDSAFTTNDLLDALTLLDRLLAEQPPAASAANGPVGLTVPGRVSGVVPSAASDAQVRWEQAALRSRLEEIARALDPALQAGGVHTPNHRWELSQALARLERRWPDLARRDRIEQWLAEGIDVDADGQYSERSANYALHVTNLSLAVLAEVMDRPDLEDTVTRNLETITLLTDPAGHVETMHSRRQDQKETFSLAGFHHQLRRAALRTGRGDLAWWAGRAWALGSPEPADELARVLLEPWTAATLPDPQAPEPQDRTLASGLAIHERDGLRMVVDGWSDRPGSSRIASGLATNPSFLHAWLDGIELCSARLSRDFFGLGPFRPQAFTVARTEGGEMAVTLREEVSAGYYQPLAPADQHPDGAYSLEFEGRFAASMAFSRRRTDTLSLATEVTCQDAGRGLQITVRTAGPTTRACLELALPEGTRLAGQPLATVTLADGVTELDTPGGLLTVTVHGATGTPGFYEPGEEYRYLGGTDALGGPRLYLTAAVPGTLTVTLEAGQ